MQEPTLKTRNYNINKICQVRNLLLFINKRISETFTAYIKNSQLLPNAPLLGHRNRDDDRKGT
jgi:hypothetical protein